MCFDSITELSSEKHEERFSNMNFYTAKMNCNFFHVKYTKYFHNILNTIQEDMQSFDSITDVLRH